MTHTRSPWKYDTVLGCKRIKGDKRGTHKQAQYKDIAYTVGLYDDDEDLANARLIAAAPSLLAALKKIAEPEGAYSRDELTHARNTIENMVAIAEKAIAEVGDV